MAAPKFLKNAETTPVPRKYHGQTVQLWKGKVLISDIEGWVDNPRIEMAIQRLRDDIGEQDITQEMVYDIMKSDREVRLKDLRDDIRKNGLREPLVLSYAGKLIDGNRRFFAVKYALENADDAMRADLERVPAFVMTENASEEQEHNILVEENFAPSLKKEWPPYVRARHIRRASEDDGLSTKEIAKRYGWTTRQVNETLRILRIADNFMAFAVGEPDPETGSDGLGMSEREAENVVDVKYQYFNEAQKSLYSQLIEGENPDFQVKFYKWLARGNFASFHEVKAAYQAYLDPEACAALEKGGEDAGKEAKAILDYKKRVVKDDKDIEHRVENLVDFLRALKADQMSRMPQHVLDKLRESLEMVVDMAESGKK